ncbi:L-threonylcarbamoyladenylate synthase [Flavobacterium sp.]|uniref:L-threonylcarbamoyladenylate synthase n=1 Tax=Flavobacterium sp. TaxID=239 RepID=UPI002605A743|nr:L-threonylcarbamoyladenylate synthase [Flavobacterium sp.]
MHTSEIQIAKLYLVNEDVVAIPTETVYGLAANIYSEKAVQKIYHLKKRPKSSPLIVHVDSIAQCEALVNAIPDPIYTLMAHFWPGPLTVLLPKNDSVPEWVTGESPFVGIRMPNHALTLDLIRECGFPLAAPSANPFSKISPTTAQMVDHYFKEDAVFVLNGGPCSSGLESTIVGFENNQVKVYRLGALSLEAITAVVGDVLYEGKPDKVFFTPGRFPKHYAPNTPVVLTEDLESTLTLYGEDTTQRIAVLSYFPIQNLPENCQLFLWEINENWEAVAQQLYATLFSIDRMQFDVMLIQKFPEEGLGKTINDRLNRASIQ